MGRIPFIQRHGRKLLGLLTVIAVGLAAVHILGQPASGAQLGYRSLQLSNNQSGATTSFGLAFERSSPGIVGSVLVEFCANDPFPGTPCTPPGGLDAGNASLTAQDGMTGFSVNPAGTNANQILLSRTPFGAPVGQSRYQFDGLVNASSPSTYYVRIMTYTNSSATGQASDDGGIAFQVTNNFQVTATVPPYLTFCTGVTITGLNCVNAQGNYVDFGELSTSRSRSGTSQMLVATNAADGFNISFQGTTLTSGNNEIRGLANGDVSRPGTAQFGLNLRANVAPAVGANPSGPGTSGPQTGYGQANIYRFGSGETLVSNPKPEDVRLYTASYIANIPATQAAGIYVSTLTYICLANF